MKTDSRREFTASFMSVMSDQASERGPCEPVNSLQKEEMDNFMFQHRELARGASGLSPNLTRADKARLWAELTSRLNHIGPPRNTERWKRVWLNRVCKARKRCAVVEAERRKTGRGTSQVRLSSTYSRILCIVGVDSALGAPGFRVPHFPEEEVQPVGAPAEEHPASQDAGDVLKEEEDADHEASTSTQMPQPRARQATVRRRLPRRVPRASRQERRDEADFSAVANQQRLLDANVGRDSKDERFQGQITLGMGQLLERLAQNVGQLAQNVGRLAQNVVQQTQSMDRIAENIQEGVLSMQQNAAFMREVILQLSGHALRQPQPQAQPQPQPQPQAQPQPQLQAESQAEHLAQPPGEDDNN
ncbi:uncharacterized protein LOC120837444 [Ixodes scapularis]|uniref:uncharacterized protein LOC120837444 n=1 Tax=Ixodes scapularis TaxID=6945 RepID=UPI001C37FA2C|nr:uncharacterized protein LOC120837444 [Ixodes scapularis]